ncbi:MAG: hypothetical protein PHP87_05210 [Syntrophomonas sp.]|uniref:hypothetical protein n=1 Tax=Syntrophomonas sp. TaxID=2053627 RepID=UPI00262B248E|nr:hypothetical protein [Syntrophomonas sp.]MDD4626464.1 hypothetical protein [Syntrophomonas sp.]
MPRRIIYLLLISMIFTFSHSTALSQDWGSIPPIFYPVNQGSDEVQQAYSAMVKNFQLYSSLLEDVDSSTEHLISLHANDKDEAINYLSPGFEPNLASDIVEAYTQWIPGIQKLVIVPCDGIPVLTQADYNKCSFYQPNHSSVIFRRSYSGCYSEQDSYLFMVHLSYVDESWKIEKLELLESSD